MCHMRQEEVVRVTKDAKSLKLSFGDNVIFCMDSSPSSLKSQYQKMKAFLKLFILE